MPLVFAQETCGFRHSPWRYCVGQQSSLLFGTRGLHGELMTRSASQDPMQTLRTMIKWDGVQSSLQYLNSLTQHRYTGLFLFDGERLKNTYIHDRQATVQSLFPEMAANYSYCLTVKKSGQPFRVVNAPQDERLVGHPSRDSVKSYCGAPLRDLQGEVFGTVCNFSLDPCHSGDEEIPLLEGFAAVLLECERLREIGWRNPTKP